MIQNTKRRANQSGGTRVLIAVGMLVVTGGLALYGWLRGHAQVVSQATVVAAGA